MSEQQTYANHRRFDPSYHFFLMPFSLLGILATAYYLARHPSL